MAGFFVWDVHDIAPNSAMGVLCIFKPPGPMESASLLETIRSSLKASTLPIEVVVIYAAGYEVESLRQQFSVCARDAGEREITGDRPLLLAGITDAFSAADFGQFELGIVKLSAVTSTS